jgi:hypothetical protein
MSRLRRLGSPRRVQCAIVRQVVHPPTPPCLAARCTSSPSTGHMPTCQVGGPFALWMAMLARTAR